MRAFVAIDLPPSIQSDLAALQQRLATVLAGAQPGRSVRWIPAANLHLTLRFLGETTPAQHAAVAARLRTLAKSSGAFEITVSGLGCFPNDHRPTVLWLGVARGEERLPWTRALLPRGARGNLTSRWHALRAAQQPARRHALARSFCALPKAPRCARGATTSPLCKATCGRKGLSIPRSTGSRLRLHD